MARQSTRGSDRLSSQSRFSTDWFSTDWFSARDALTFGAGAMLMLAASRLAPPVAGRAIGSIRAMAGTDPFDALAQDLSSTGIEVVHRPDRTRRLVALLRRRLVIANVEIPRRTDRSGRDLPERIVARNRRGQARRSEQERRADRDTCEHRELQERAKPTPAEQAPQETVGGGGHGIEIVAGFALLASTAPPRAGASSFTACGRPRASCAVALPAPDRAVTLAAATARRAAPARRRRSASLPPAGCAT